MNCQFISVKPLRHRQQANQQRVLYIHRPGCWPLCTADMQPNVSPLNQAQTTSSSSHAHVSVIPSLIVFVSPASKTEQRNDLTQTTPTEETESNMQETVIAVRGHEINGILEDLSMTKQLTPLFYQTSPPQFCPPHGFISPDLLRLWSCCKLHSDRVCLFSGLFCLSWSILETCH